MWLSGNESDKYPGRCRFDSWPRSVGEGSSVAVSCGVGCRRGSDPELLWLWCRPAVKARIRPLAWEPPYAKGAAYGGKKTKKTKKTNKKKNVSGLRTGRQKRTKTEISWE